MNPLPSAKPSLNGIFSYLKNPSVQNNQLPGTAEQAQTVTSPLPQSPLGKMKSSGTALSSMIGSGLKPIVSATEKASQVLPQAAMNPGSTFLTPALKGMGVPGPLAAGAGLAGDFLNPIPGAAESKIAETAPKVLPTISEIPGIIKNAYSDIVSGGGTTVDLFGQKPSSGFAFAPSKGTETVIPQEKFTEKEVEDFFNKYYDTLKQEGMHFGGWVDGNQVYLDLSKVLTNESQAVNEARQSNQLAIYDIANGKTKYLSEYPQENGVLPYRGKDQGANDSGSQASPQTSGNAQINSVISQLVPRAIEKDPALSAVDKAVENQAINLYTTNHQSMIKDYLSKFGNVVNPDNAKMMLFDANIGYDGTNSRAIHETSSAIAKDAYHVLLTTSDKPLAFFLSGGSGTGKTSVLAQKSKTIAQNAAIIFDSNLSNPKGAMEKIQQAVDAGKKPVVLHVYRDPFTSFISTIARGLRNKAERGRMVPIPEVVKNHIGSNAVVHSLLDNPNVSTELYQNTEKGLVPMSIDEFKSIQYDGNELDRSFRAAARDIYESGQINKQQYNGLLH